MKRLKTALLLACVLGAAVLVLGDTVLPPQCLACAYYPIDSWEYTICRWVNSCGGSGGW